MEVSMGLSEQEQKVLDELERQLTGGKESKPKAEKAPVAPVNYARLLVLGSILIVIGLGLIIFATSSHVIWFGVVAFIAMLSGLYLVSQNWSSRAIRASKEAKDKSKSSNKSFGSFFEDRWDQRNEGK
jgi:hypothetical protein